MTYVNVKSIKPAAQYTGTNSYRNYYEHGLLGQGAPLLWKAYNINGLSFSFWNASEMNLWMCSMLVFFQNIILSNGEDMLATQVEYESYCSLPNATFPFCGSYHSISLVSVGRAVFPPTTKK